MQVGLGTDFRAMNRDMCWLRGGGVRFRAHSHMWFVLPHPAIPESNWRSCSSGVASDLIYSEIATHASGSGLCVSSNHLCSCPSSYNSEVSTTLSLGLISCWVARELRKIFYLPARWHLDERAARGRVGKRCRLTTLPDVTVFTSLDAFWALRFVFLWRLRYWRGSLNHWPLAPESTSSPSRPLEV